MGEKKAISRTKKLKIPGTQQDAQLYIYRCIDGSPTHTIVLILDPLPLTPAVPILPSAPLLFPLRPPRQPIPRPPSPPSPPVPPSLPPPTPKFKPRDGGEEEEGERGSSTIHEGSRGRCGGVFKPSRSVESPGSLRYGGVRLRLPPPLPLPLPPPPPICSYLFVEVVAP